MKQKKNLDNVAFTFYGDLLGVSNLYRIDLSLARDRLDRFYNMIYVYFKSMAKRKEIEILLFSDFVLITGKRFKKTVQKLSKIYNELLDENILIKGAMVKGELEYENRIQLKNLQKRLPLNDILFRAVSLEKSVNGMRLVLEKDLAKEILPCEWLNDEQYEKHVCLGGYTKGDLRRKIVLMSEWNAYEYLWPYTWGLAHFNNREFEVFEMKFFKHPYIKIKERLPQIPKEARVHLRETMKLFKRAEHRQRIVSEALMYRGLCP